MAITERYIEGNKIYFNTWILLSFETKRKLRGNSIYHKYITILDFIIIIIDLIIQNLVFIILLVFYSINKNLRLIQKIQIIYHYKK